ncbi:hypothetical protein [Embleya hyalina]|uniref:Uncharacterized protein n=1 Tax=Embleya hyalina TaxID=516124 RepID=A0A401YN58_9ACTN|nr:hypothetical protein [Embleya hyalina]GCD96035.1 hypothetical protein EHYA_03719 [Embleya hyalina]
MRFDEEHRAMYCRLEPALQAPPDPALEPINRAQDANMCAFVPVRPEGLRTPGRQVGLDDLVPGLPREDVAPQPRETVDLLFGRPVEAVADLIRCGEST